MNKRQRKKNRIGEFVTYGFEVKISLNLTTPSPETDTLYSEFIDDAVEYVESKSLLIGIGGPPDYVIGYVTAHRGKRLRSVTEDERVEFSSWLTSHELVKTVLCGPLVEG